jgi:SAM-dependent methyltransferase
MNALDYWDEQFKADWQRRGSENRMLALDFYAQINGEDIGRPIFVNALRAPRIIELGCGTGEFTGVVEWAFRPEWMVGTDLSPVAIEQAKRRYPFLRFEVLDFLAADAEQKMDGAWDLAIASNVLEHFTEPTKVIDRILSFAGKLLAIVPYRQPVTDAFDAEGGAGHVSSFAKGTFKKFTVLDSLIFETGAWSYSSAGEKPKQLAVLIEPK